MERLFSRAWLFIKYKLGRATFMADALSYKVEITNTSWPQSDLQYTAHSLLPVTLVIGLTWRMMWRPMWRLILCVNMTRSCKEHPVRLSKPLPIPKRQWKSVSMDFIVGLLTSEHCNWVLLMVDWYSKHAFFTHAPKQCSAEKTAHLFFNHIVKYWDSPQFMVNG